MFCSRAVFFLPQFVNALQKSLDLTLTNENVVCYWTFNSILSFVKQQILLSYHYIWCRDPGSNQGPLDQHTVTTRNFLCFYRRLAILQHWLSDIFMKVPFMGAGSSRSIWYVKNIGQFRENNKSTLISKIVSLVKDSVPNLPFNLWRTYPVSESLPPSPSRTRD